MPVANTERLSRCQPGVAGETILIFTSDNGGNMYNQVDGTTPTNTWPLRGGKATIHEGGLCRTAARPSPTGNTILEKGTPRGKAKRARAVPGERELARPLAGE